MIEMDDVIVIGSGPSAVGAIAALLERGIRPMVIDFGADTDKDAQELKVVSKARLNVGSKAFNRTIQTNLDSVGQKHWFGSLVSYEQPVASQIIYEEDLTVRASFGLGGFSRVWGATFKFDSNSAMLHAGYQLNSVDIEAIKTLVPHVTTWSGDLGEGIEPAHASRVLIERITAKKFSNENVEPSVVAIDIHNQLSGCVRCGACLTGCPVDAIWFAGDQIKKWQSNGQINYESGIYVEKISEERNHVSLYGTRDGKNLRIDARRAFVATGPISTAALLLRSQIGDRYIIRDSATAFGGAIDYRRTQRSAHHGLSQFWLSAPDKYVAQIYPPSKDHALRAISKFHLPSFMVSPLGSIVNHIHPIITYLPMVDSGTIAVHSKGKEIHVSAVENAKTVESFAGVFRRLRHTFARAGLFVPIRGFEVGSPGSGFHIGASLPHGELSDAFGRPNGMERVHIIDASVLPTLPLGSITPSVMANAHRIARTTDLSSN